MGSGRSGRWGAVTAIAWVTVLCWAGTASAATFTVDSTSDDADAVSNGTCATALGVCTLRAALQEANAGAGGDVIDFASNVKGAGNEITIGSVLPAITDTTEIYGCEAPTVPSATVFATAPCTGIRAPTANAKTYDALTIAGGNVIIQGLAITNVDRGIKSTATTLGSDRRIWGNWFGLKLDGSPEGNNVGVEVTGTNITIGGTAGAPGTAMAERNVFAANGFGVRIRGGQTGIQGNYFGVKADGTTAAPNTTAAIRVSGATASAHPSGIFIGGVLTAGEQATAECDGVCNVIAGGSAPLSRGIQLWGSGEGAADGVSISGNYVGIDKTGLAALATTVGIDVGDADHVTVGGTFAGQRNVIAASNTGVIAGGAGNAMAFTLSHNYVGTDWTGDLERGGEETGVNVRSAAAAATPADPSNPAKVTDNVIAVGTNYGMLLSGQEGTISGNSIGVGPTRQDIGGGIGTNGIRLVEGGLGNPGDDMLVDQNVIGNAGRGVSLEGGDDNTFIRNLFGVDGNGDPQDNALAGISIRTFIDQQPTGNVIGSDTASEENVLSNTTGNAFNTGKAISIDPDVVAGNTIKGNHGDGNGRFIDIGNPGAGNGTAAQEGVEAPQIVVANEDRVFGTGTPGAAIRLFFKATLDPGEVASQRAGTGTVQSDGTWEWTPSATMTAGQRVAVTQTTSPGGSTSELSEPATLAASNSSDTTAPAATITPPTSPTNDSTPAFGLDSNETPELFICAIDAAPGPYSACSDPYEPTTLSDGTHTIYVRAVDAAGNVEATPGDSATVTVDTVAPVAPTINEPGGLTNDPTPTFTFTGEGPSFDCAVDPDTPADCSGHTFTAGAQGQGLHTFQVTTTDAADNESPQATRQFTVDTVAPDTQLDSGPSGPTNDSTPTFSYSAPGETHPGTFECKVDTVSVSCPGSSSGSFTPSSALPDGAHTFTVRAVDAALNQDPAAESRSFTVDTVAPAAPNITSGPFPAPAAMNDPTPSFTYSGESGATFSCAIDGGAPVGCDGGSFTPATLSDGSHTFTVKQADAATNQSPPASRTFIVDSTPPETQIDSGPADGEVTDSTPVFGFSSPGNPGVGFRCRFDSQQFGSCNGAAPLTAGPHTFEVKAVDPAGNQDATPARRTFKVGACGGRAVTYIGTGRGDLLKGTPKPDVILGLGGGDVIRGLGGNDVMCGGGGADRINGGPGKDVLLGQGGADTLTGGPGKDRLVGGAGKDSQRQ
jgi:hypothetical protein